MVLAHSLYVLIGEKEIGQRFHNDVGLYTKTYLTYYHRKFVSMKYIRSLCFYFY
uniref:Uncharacterized protein n=1 Tax=Nelumbo nucifera TaxID=4432 RepID=A0A822XEW5_NELNU|nr:TPA_asm: hypothetical protein HUJ06_020200 [Nelumbo nucifera]